MKKVFSRILTNKGETVMPHCATAAQESSRIKLGTCPLANKQINRSNHLNLLYGIE